jgi:L-arabinokinase
VHIAYFVTSHGYGHGVRAATIANALSPEIKITFRTSLPETFFKEELKRSFNLVPAHFDCGCIQSDSVTVDIKRTLETYTLIAQKNRLLLQNEIGWCREQNVDCIVSDITPFAFEIAAKLGIPSVAVSNFTWYDIYKDYCSVVPEFQPYLEEMLEQYKKADLLLALTPALEMEYFRKNESVPIIGRIGNSIKKEIYKKYNIASDKKTGLIYIGDFGMDGASWEKLEGYHDWVFLGLHPLAGNPDNFRLIDKHVFRYQDLTASVDIVISKLGYGVVSECFLNGTPLIYLPRENFVEYPVLEKAVQCWGGGVCLSDLEFYGLQWSQALNILTNVTIPLAPFLNGVSQCAESIEMILSK